MKELTYIPMKVTEPDLLKEAEQKLFYLTSSLKALHTVIDDAEFPDCTVWGQYLLHGEAHLQSAIGYQERKVFDLRKLKGAAYGQANQIQ